MLVPRRGHEIPLETVQVAQAAFPKGNKLMTLRDALGPIFEDEAVVLTSEQARLLTSQHAPTAQGIRDRLLMCLLLDLGLRASEVSGALLP